MININTWSRQQQLDYLHLPTLRGIAEGAPMININTWSRQQ